MSTSWLSCRRCIGSDPIQDTVKIDPNVMFREQSDKENTRPMQVDTKRRSRTLDPCGNDMEQELSAKEQKLVEERRKQAAEVAKRLQQEQLEAAKVAKARMEAERRRQEQAAAAEKAKQETERLHAAQEAAELALAREEAVAAAAASQERLRQAEEAATALQEAQFAAELRAKLEQEEAEAAEIAAAQVEVNAWCKDNGFSDMNVQKKTLRGATKYPLHTAVKQQDTDMVRLLLKCGANKDATSSKKQSPLDLALKMSNGLPDTKTQNIIAMLQ